MKWTKLQIIIAAVFGCLFFFLCLFAGCVAVWDYFSPPKEAVFIRNFQAHRGEFERLRTMLEEDNQPARLDLNSDAPCPSWLPAARYHEYLKLLQQVHGQSASCDEDDPAAPSVVLWAEGFAGDSQTVEICWLEEAPTNQVQSLDHYTTMATRYNRIWTYRHIETNWYLRTDR